MQQNMLQKNFEKNLLTYRELVSKNKLLTLDTWTTVQALNINQLNDIKEYCRKFEIRHEFALLENPSPLNVKYKNKRRPPLPEILFLRSNKLPNSAISLDFNIDISIIQYPW